jgi:hypothetical protein
MTQSTAKQAAVDASTIVNAVYARLFGKQRRAELSERVCYDVEAMFSGNYGDFAASDTPYHNFEHTVHVMVCFSEIMEGRHMAKVEPLLSFRQFELGLTAVLLHDTGYLKSRSDVKGTGAKYTQTHVQRSCELATKYLPEMGVTARELEFVLEAIFCTSVTTFSQKVQHRFDDPVEGLMGCAVASADCLGQMSAPHYMESLPLLFEEFQESDDFEGVPEEKRMFKTLEDLVRGTPNFWRKVILPRLENELLGVYRFLARPYPNGENYYVNAINETIARIERETWIPEKKKSPFARFIK